MRKTLLAACAALIMGGVNLQAQTTDYTSLTDNFKLVASGTAGTEIKLATKTQVYSYTPTATGDVTFSRYNGSMLVYEGENFKGYIPVAENPNSFVDPVANDDGTVTNSLLVDGSFYNHGAEIVTDKWSFGPDWLTNVTCASGGIRVGKQTGAKDGIVLVWRGAKDRRYFAQKLTGVIKPGTKYKVTVNQVAGGNAVADFNVGLGSTVNGLEYCTGTLKNLGNGKNGVKSVEFTSPASVADDVYFTFINTDVCSSGSDPVTQLDYIALVEATPLYAAGLTGATEKSYEADTYQLPTAVWNGDFEAGAASSADLAWENATVTYEGTTCWYGVRKGWSAGGVLAADGTAKINDATVPAGASGNVYALCAAWGSGATAYAYQYIHLPAGRYRMTYDIAAAQNVAGTNASGVYVNGTNLVKDATLPTKTATWESHICKFEVTADCDAEVRIAYVAADEGSAKQARLFFDNVSVVPAPAEDYKPELKSLIASVNIPTANIGYNAFQFSQAAVDALTVAKAAAQNVYDNTSATVADVQNAIAALKAAVATFKAAPLNATPAGAKYTIQMKDAGLEWSDKVVNVFPRADQGGYDMGFKAGANMNYLQAFTFTQVTGGWNISFEDVDGVHYICTGDKVGSTAGWKQDQIRATTVVEDALLVYIEPDYTTEDIYRLINTTTDTAMGSTDNDGFYCSNDHQQLALAQTGQAKVTIAVKEGVLYSTVILPFSTTVSSMTVNSCSAKDGGDLTLVDEGGKIEARKPYILSADNAQEEILKGWGMQYYNTTTYTEGLLTGTFEEIALAPVGVYVLQKNNDKVAFYLVTDAAQPKIGANRAYLTVPAEGGSVREFFAFGNDVATGIDEAKAAESNERIYDLSGRVVKNATKGIFIINNKKVLK